jgi:hypothetical protein
MRAVILILILAVVALIVAVASGLVDIRQTRDAAAPGLQANSSGVTATGGQAPAFDVETGKVAIGSQPKNVTVQVPAIKVERPAEANAASNETK